jgi:hypothetical protein
MELDAPHKPGGGNKGHAGGTKTQPSKRLRQAGILEDFVRCMPRHDLDRNGQPLAGVSQMS